MTRLKTSLQQKSPYMHETLKCTTGKTPIPKDCIFEKDCLDALRDLPEDTVDLVLTDPPYNLGGHMKSRGSGVHRLRPNHFSTQNWDNLRDDDWIIQMERLSKDLFRVCKKGSAAIIFMSILKAGLLKDIFESAGFYYKTTGIWHKTNPIPRNMRTTFVNSTETWLYFTKGTVSGTFNNNDRSIHDFIETGLTPKSEKRFGKHPTQKPLRVMTHFVSLLSNEGDLVLDPFVGSGTTTLAAHILGRSYLGFDLDPQYVAIAKTRLENHNDVTY